MNFMENRTRSKADIKANFLAFFKIEEVAHLAMQNLKDIKQVLGESVKGHNLVGPTTPNICESNWDLQNA